MSLLGEFRADKRSSRILLIQSTGAIITANASGMSMFLGGRWLTGKSALGPVIEIRAHGPGFGCSAASMSAKLYIAEIAPPRSRGAWMGVLNSFYYVGQILASGVAVSHPKSL